MSANISTAFATGEAIQAYGEKGMIHSAETREAAQAELVEGWDHARTTDPSNAVTQYTYNKRNELTDITDALGGITHYDYEAEGRAIKATDPGHDSPTGSTRVVTQYAFDADGRIIKNTDGNGNIVSYRLRAEGAKGD